ncbi:MAG: ABC transporter permease, partial [Candidatus Melainabacteria bacterium]|nr:ABC transporter permease [Candidatus Melainabacteria bacterium]
MFSALTLKELRELVATRSFWVMLLVLSPLIGFSFIEAVFIYGHAGESIMGNEVLLGRLSPLDGIVMPTFSAMYMSEVFLFPFVAIRLLGVEKQFGSIKFLLQICPQISIALLVKALVAMLAFMISLIPALSALMIWYQMGGYLYMPEILVLLLGHFLFAFLITSIAFFSVAITDSPQTAAIVTLAFTISSWVLEFAGQNQSTLSAFSWLSMTAHLRLFESALFSLQTVMGFLTASVALLSLAAIWLHSKDGSMQKFRKSLALAIFVSVAALAESQAFYFKDFSETRSNSFNPKNEAELRKITLPLTINIRLDPDDSISVDFERNFLS